MSQWFRLACFCVLSSAAIEAAGLVRDENVVIFGGRRVSVTPPAGFSLTTGRDEAGEMALKVSDIGGRHSVEISFLPDAEGKHRGSRARRELMNELFKVYVASSKEKGMQFEELEPRIGAGTYCVFTDAALIGRTELPPGDYLHLTAGLKAWPGVVAVFRFFTDEINSSEYHAVMKMLRESLVERPVPLR